MGNSFCAFGDRSDPPNRTSTSITKINTIIHLSLIVLKRPELEEALSDYMNNTLKLEGNRGSETTSNFLFFRI